MISYGGSSMCQLIFYDDMMKQHIRLLKANVWHRRERPKHNEFTYGVFYVAYPVDEEYNIQKPRLFSFNHFNILSLYAKDLGPKNGGRWLEWIRAEYARAGVSLANTDTIELITHPRLFGYAFNPISFWILCNADQKIKAVLCEVHNTFGDDHNYVFVHEGGRAIERGDVFRAEKSLYVSPFNTMDGYYTFSFEKNEKQFKASIIYYVGDAFVLKTALLGEYETLSSLKILSLIVQYPLMTIMVVVRIHWQALVLFLKKMKHTLAQRPHQTHGDTTRGEEYTKAKTSV